jgi:hypothetical protein
MNFKKWLPVAAVLLLAGFLHSCTKKPQGSSINAGFKSFFDYQEGSYWIFYDSVIKNYDSLYVNGYNDAPANVADGVNELVTISMNEYYLDSVNGNQWILGLLGPSTAAMNIGSDTIDNYIIANNFPFKTGLISESGTAFSSRTITSYPTYSIGGNTYSNVYQIAYAYHSGSYGDTIYINADYGFLAILLNNQYSHKRLFLSRSNIIH